MDKPLVDAAETKRIALLAACAAILQVVESCFPSPFPGVRLGLANAVAVVALIDLGARAALEVAMLRTVIASFLLGTFLSPTFLLSFFAALASSAAMALAHRWNGFARRPVLSVVGLSLVGAAVHNVTQIGLVYALLARHAGVFLLLPWLGLSAVVMGWITGLVAAYACRRLAEYPTHFDSEPPRPRVAGERDGGKTRAFSPHLPSLPHKAAGDTVHNSQFEPGNSTLHRLPAAAKIVAAAALALLVVWLHEVWCFAVVTLLLCGSALMGRAFSLRWFAVIFKLRLFLVFAFLAPLLLVQTGVVWWRAGPLIVTDDGVVAAARVVWRIALLMLGTALLVRTTSPEALAAGLGKVLAPLRAAGLPTGRFVALLSLAWSFVPPLWDRAHEVVRQQIGKGTWKHILPALGDTMAAMYREADLAGG